MTSTTTVHALSLAGIIRYSADPERLAAFHRDRLGLPLGPAQHGTMGPHIEGLLAATHFAFWDERAGHGSGAIVPVYRVANLAEAAAELERAGTTKLHGIVDLGEGKRVAGFADPDGYAFRLIELR